MITEIDFDAEIGLFPHYECGACHFRFWDSIETKVYQAEQAEKKRIKKK